MLVRVRSKDGLFRFPLEPSDDAALLIAKTLETAPDAEPESLTFSNQPRGGEMSAASLRGTSLAELGIAHGHLLYAAYTPRAPSGEAGPSSAASGSIALPSNGAATSSTAAAGKKAAAAPAPWETVQEEAVDRFWQAADGKIPRPRDQKMCRHGEKAMCDYCMPLEPYDAAYHAEHQIKHLSFNAYLRKQDIAMNKPSQSYIPPLEEADYSVKVPCPSGQHASWPGGICTKCQPSAITLQSQAYRMLDHVEFAHPRLIEHLLAFWRATGTQRFGFLLGRHEAYDKVPMGIKAVVEAIVEPPQEGELDGLTLGVPWAEQARVEALAKQCGLDIVGVIYTDLTPADPTLQDASKAGKVACKRHKDSFFLSGCEVLFAATLQQANASPSRFSRSGRFNSKFVTCVLSGTEDGAIDVSAYQISEQGMAMVKADMIEASVNPNIIRVRPSEGSRYVPEVFYRYKNAYKIDVKESAKPTFPVEYLLVTVTHGFPNEPKPAFLSSSFPIENRPGLHDQDLGRACSAIAQAVGPAELYPREFGVASDAETRRREKLVGVLSDWHLLCFLDTCGILDADDMKALCRVATTHDAGEALDALLGRTGWQTLSAIAREHAPQGPSAVEESKPKSVGDMMGMSGSSSARDPITPRAKPAAAAPPAPAAPARAAPAAALMGSGRADDPLIYNGDDDDDIELDSDDEEDELEYADDGMFEDAASSAGAHEVAHAPPARAASPPPEQDDDMGASAGGKACPHCTFINERSSGDCDVCGLPLSG